jgi:hypothetical protein
VSLFHDVPRRAPRRRMRGTGPASARPVLRAQRDSYGWRVASRQPGPLQERKMRNYKRANSTGSNPTRSGTDEVAPDTLAAARRAWLREVGRHGRHRCRVHRRDRRLWRGNNMARPAPVVS